VARGDFDNDGLLDLVMRGETAVNTYVLKVLRNTGTGFPFTEIFNGAALPQFDGGLACGDFNNDGTLDFIVTGYDFNSATITRIYYNFYNAGGGFQESSGVLPGKTGVVAPGDFDHDGDLDILLCGTTAIDAPSGIYDFHTYLYENEIPTPDVNPGKPSGLTHSISAGKVIFTWNKAADAEQQDGLSYNLRIGSVPNGFDKLSPMSDVFSGYRRIVSLGGADLATIKKMNLPAGQYCWSVQSIDHTFAGSQFADEDCFSISDICGTKYNDLNGNGIRDGGEPGMPFWQINLGGAATSTAITNINGDYCFHFLSPGNYTVSETPQPCWRQTAPPFPGVHNVTVSSGLSIDNLDFGNQAYQLDISVDPYDPPCNGGWGGFTIYASGGAPWYSVQISPCPIWAMPCSYTFYSIGFSTIASYPAGTYSIIVTDANGCSASTTATINEPPDLGLSFNVTAIDCSLSAIDLTVTGGAVPRSFLWSYNSANTEDLNNVPPGTYTVTVTDANGCTKTGTVLTTLNCDFGDAPDEDFAGNPFPVPYPTLLADDGACAFMTPLIRLGFEIDAVDVEPDGQPHPTAVGDDMNGYDDEDGVTILPLNPFSNQIQINLFNNWPSTVYLSGWIDYNVNHIWENNPLTEKIIDSYIVPPGVSQKTVTITTPPLNLGMFARFRISDHINVGPDNPPGSLIPHGEVEDYEITILPLYLQIIGQPVTCHGTNTGACDAEVSGGRPPYTYLWNNGATTGDLTDLFAGVYSVTVTDANNSTASGSVTVTEPQQLAPTPFSEGFEAVTFPPACWTNLPVSGSNTWIRSAGVSGNGAGTGSAMANFYDQVAGAYELKTFPFDISGMTAPILAFNYAYATYVGEIDEMDVSYSTDYGTVWHTLLNMPGGFNGILNTGGAAEDSFVPAPSQWRNQTLPLPAGTNMLKFKAISAYGNNLYLDNINVTDHSVVPVDNTIQNVAVAGNECYNATNTIIVAGGGTGFTVINGGSATFIAGQKINFMTGTTVQPGGTMHGYIAQTGPWCGAKSAAIVTASEAGTEVDPGAENSFFTIYPNPTTGSFSLELKGIEYPSELRVEMYGVYGEHLFSEDLKGQKKYDLSLAGKPAGVYFIRVITGKLAGTVKIIRQ
jgi:hypothetical protein